MQTIVGGGIKLDSTDRLSRNKDSNLSQDRIDPALGLLVKELQHRIRNLLSIVQCFVTQTNSPTAADYRAALLARISHLSDAYGLIEQTKAGRTLLPDLLQQTLKPFAFAKPDQILVSGPDVELEPNLALALHVAFHELATNACQHGALSSESGQVAVVWEMLSGPAGQILAAQWSERGGPPASEPDQYGFGLQLITKAIANATVKLTFDRTGLICWFLIPINTR